MDTRGLTNPRAVQGYADVLSQVAAIAAVIPLEHLEVVREILSRQEVEKLAAEVDWVQTTHRPPQSWFDEQEDPFEPEEERAPL